jgi:hypothetical protein
VPERVELDADERAAIELWLRRRGALGSARDEELAEMIAEPLLARHGMTRPHAGSNAARALALLFDRAENAGRSEAPPSSRAPSSWRRLG